MFKKRTKSKELKIYQSLDSRKTLNSKEKHYFAGLEKGFIGEKMFDEWLHPVLENRILLPDMQFMPDTTFVQIDTILITSNKIYLFEVKNNEGDHIIEGDNLLRTDRTNTKNPILQLKRNEPVFRWIMENLGYRIPIQSIAVFVNPRFHLYNAPADLPIVFPNQIERFIAKLEKSQSSLKRSHSELAAKLLSTTIAENPYARIPDYQYEELSKGIICPKCRRLYTAYSKYLSCRYCNFKEDSNSAVSRSLKEFKTLFPERKLTVSQAMEWCGIVKDRKTIKLFLAKNFKLVYLGRSSYYI
ncbi:NERD domain-containing protein [Bacillus salacetis]|uniref:NERD domain-containing protein n=1 Tax=Bacillus salacetis TaxID=2315464 RepID=A0A3A1R459_9BACI|nr:NERD domain-containing protein [Bacillus salacetis]